jgi:hypothetical protein
MLDAYPNVRHAVAFVETFLCELPPDDPETAWTLMMRARLTPSEIITCCRIAVTEATELSPRFLDAIRHEMQHPEFHRYIAGKMGAV